MTQARLSVTAVVVTSQRPLWLKRCADSLIAAAFAQGEELRLSVAIGINGRDAESVRVARAFTAGPVAFSVFELERRSPAEARNQVLAALGGAGEWIFFIDDDAYVEPDFFARFAQAAAANPKASVLGGPNLTPPGAGAFERATGVALSSRFATFLSYARYRPLGSARACGEEALILCNLFVRREALGPAPFPAHLKCAEENWLLQSLTAQGRALVYDPLLALWHERRSSPLSLAAQVYKYGYGRGQNIRSRPASLQVAHVVPVLCLAYAIAAALALLFGADPLYLLAPVGAYFLVGLVAAARAICLSRASFIMLPVVLCLFMLIHVAYGAGVARGAAAR